MNKNKEILPAIVVILFGAVFYALSFRIQATTSDVLGSRFFPQAASVLIMVLSAIQILLELRKKGEDTVSVKAEEEKPAGPEARKKSTMALAMTVAALFAYYILIRLIGFTITSILYLLFESWVLMSDADRKNRKMTAVVILTSVLVPVFLNFIFYNVFRIKLPVGSLLD